MSRNTLKALAGALVQRHGAHYEASMNELVDIYGRLLDASESVRANPALTQVGRRDAFMKDAKTAHAQLKKYEAATASVQLRLDIARNNALPRPEMTADAIAKRREVRDRTQALSRAELAQLYLEAARDGRVLVVHAIDENPLGVTLTDDTRTTARQIMLAAAKDPDIAALEECVGLRETMTTSTRLRMQELVSESGVSWADVERQ